MKYFGKIMTEKDNLAVSESDCLPERVSFQPGIFLIKQPLSH